ncbi:GYD domain-containing protein [Pelagibius sp.]|uniref:GYD domain-containing protein n=1 Tax=Pelagibius sp. TaxID=1931238 RepID=UPI00260E25E4|nr:GYD domain-containing protein [Pelagibius sp.]
MATYISLVNYTEQGIKAIKDSPKRVDGVRLLAKKLGGEMNDLYLTMGSYDLVAISEFPDDAAAAQFALTLGSLGNVRTTTLQAFTEDQFRDIVAKLP